MALKVLLADDSAAIKKVVQLSLQDMGLELKNIGSGQEALEAAKQFKPDIAFIDVLLPQKSGYDVAYEIKKEKSLKSTPVVLLWSAFMAFDEGKFNSCGADAKLEKPFESGALRDLVSKLVPAAATNPLGKHLEFPKVEFEVPIGSVPPAKNKGAAKPNPTPPPLLPPLPNVEPTKSTTKNTAEDWSMASFEDINSFSSKIEEEAAEITKTEAHIPEFAIP